LSESSNLSVDHQQIRDPNGQLSEERGKQKNVIENSINEIDVPSISPAGESYRSMGEILSSMDPAHPLPMPEFESGAGKPMGKVTGSNVNAKRSTFWGRSNVSCHMFCLGRHAYALFCQRLETNMRCSSLLTFFIYLFIYLQVQC
jgi:hypothetical protein